VTRHTWAPRGETPIQYASARHDRLSVIGAVSLAPRRRRITTYFRFHDDNIHAQDVVSFVRDLHRSQQGCLILVLDRFNVHRAAVRQLCQRRPHWLEVEWLPAYAPDLNPVEAMWSCTKHGDLANYLPEDLYELGGAVVDSLDRQRRDRRIKESYFHTAKLDL
jgi:transposase